MPFGRPEHPFIDLRERRFGRYTVKFYAGRDRENSNQKHRYWKCLCDCGTWRLVRQDHLTRGKILSCGCFARDLHSRRMLAATQLLKALESQTA